MAYNLIYNLEFDSLKLDPVQPYRTMIYKKNFDGVPTNVTGAGVPVSQQWQQDEASPAVKGSNLTVTMINPGNLALSNFFSPEDDTFKVEHYWGSQLLFTGFLVQADFPEIQIDITHEISLSFTDNLGLLKDVPFNEANRLVGDKRTGTYLIHVLEDTYFRVDSITTGALIGDTMVVEGTTADGVYTIVNVVIGGGVTFIYVAEALPFDIPIATPATLTFITTQDLSVRIPMTKFIEICLKTTGLELQTHVWNKLVPDGGAVERMFDDVFLGGETFRSGDSWQSCYDVLVNLLGRVDCTLFQSYGHWNIVRWDELLIAFRGTQTVTRQIASVGYIEMYFGHTPIYPGDTIIITGSGTAADGTYVVDLVGEPSTSTNVQVVGTLPSWVGNPTASIEIIPAPYTADIYDADMIYVGEGGIIQRFEYGTGSIETGLLASIIRPLKFDKETFDYKQPILIKNQSLQELGKKISTITVGDLRTDKYEFPVNSGWVHFFGDTAYITVITQLLPFGLEAEKERYIYQPKTPATPDIPYTMFNSIEVTAGDVMDFSFQIKSASSTGGDAVIYRIGFSIQTGVGTFYNLVNGLGFFDWNTGIARGSQISVTSLAADAQTYFQFTLSDQGGSSVRVPSFPVDGLLQIYVYGTSDTNVSQPDVDCIWNDLNLTIYNYITESTKVIGQTHTDTQNPVIKNNNEKNVQIDDSPRNTINGTMLLDTFHNLVRDRTSLWANRGMTAPKFRLGEVITKETLFRGSIPRTKLEGNLLGLVQPGVYRFTGTATFTYNDVDPVPEYYVYFPDIPPGILVPGVTFAISGTIYNNGAHVALSYQSGPLPSPPTGIVFSVPPGQTAELDVVCTVTILDISIHLSLLNLIKYTQNPTLNFIFGMLNIKFRENQANGTLYEICKEGEDQYNLTESYIFKYLYSNT